MPSSRVVMVLLVPKAGASFTGGDIDGDACSASAEIDAAILLVPPSSCTANWQLA